MEKGSACTTTLGVCVKERMSGLDVLRSIITRLEYPLSISSVLQPQHPVPSSNTVIQYHYPAPASSTSASTVSRNMSVGTDKEVAELARQLLDRLGSYEGAESPTTSHNTSADNADTGLSIYNDERMDAIVAALRSEATAFLNVPHEHAERAAQLSEQLDDLLKSAEAPRVVPQPGPNQTLLTIVQKKRAAVVGFIDNTKAIRNETQKMLKTWTKQAGQEKNEKKEGLNKTIARGEKMAQKYQGQLHYYEPIRRVLDDLVSLNLLCLSRTSCTNQMAGASVTQGAGGACQPGVKGKGTFHLRVLVPTLIQEQLSEDAGQGIR